MSSWVCVSWLPVIHTMAQVTSNASATLRGSYSHFPAFLCNALGAARVSVANVVILEGTQPHEAIIRA